ncbi:hypothetical protein M1295_00335 [Patescibacteria group bacterium]|nr:hypothetical protein [Patescibacteria group bacterium]
MYRNYRRGYGVSLGVMVVGGYINRRVSTYKADPQNNLHMFFELLQACVDKKTYWQHTYQDLPKGYIEKKCSEVRDTFKRVVDKLPPTPETIACLGKAGEAIGPGVTNSLRILDGPWGELSFDMENHARNRLVNLGKVGVTNKPRIVLVNDRRQATKKDRTNTNDAGQQLLLGT